MKKTPDGDYQKTTYNVSEALFNRAQDAFHETKKKANLKRGSNSIGVTAIFRHAVTHWLNNSSKHGIVLKPAKPDDPKPYKPNLSYELREEMRKHYREILDPRVGFASKTDAAVLALSEWIANGTPESTNLKTGLRPVGKSKKLGGHSRVMNVPTKEYGVVRRVLIILRDGSEDHKRALRQAVKSLTDLVSINAIKVPRKKRASGGGAGSQGTT